MPGKIFISYRRDDDPAFAARVRDGLAAKFGQAALFMDVDNLLAGQRFDDELAKALKECDVLVAILGTRWMDVLAAKTAGNERDYVREEISAALQRRIVVIPARVGREGLLAPLPRAADLPEDIRELVQHQKHDVVHEKFGRDVAALADAIAAVRKSKQAPLPWRKLGLAAGLVALLLGGGVVAYQRVFPGTPYDPAAVQRAASAAAAVAAETKHLADLDNRLKQQSEALLKAEAENRRLAEAAAKTKRDNDERQKAEADAAAKHKADAAALAKREQEAREKDEADAAAKAKAEDAERQRLAAEAKRKADVEAARETEAARRRDPIAALQPGSGQSARDCADVCPEMVVAPAGSFTMGSPDSEPERSRGEQQLRVSIGQPFAVGKFAVTFDEWDACVADGGCKGSKPDDRGWGRGKRPVINVNWDDAKGYAAWLSRKTGKTYRLLSEAEREYVARAGTTTPFWWGKSITPKQANYNGNFAHGGGAKGETRQKTVPVDSFDANPWGLYNVHGNVLEWSEDCWNETNSGNPGNGTARTTGDCSRRVLRGGSWDNIPQFLRSAGRYWNSSVGRVYFIGFRVGRTLTPEILVSLPHGSRHLRGSATTVRSTLVAPKIDSMCSHPLALPFRAKLL